MSSVSRKDHLRSKINYFLQTEIIQTYTKNNDQFWQYYVIFVVFNSFDMTPFLRKSFKIYLIFLT